MSRTRQREFTSNPATYFFKWAGNGDLWSKKDEKEGKGKEGEYQGGYWQYFDKSLGDNGENVRVEAEDLKGLILLEWDLFSITGFSMPLEAYCYSNEVRDPKKDKLTIRNFANKIKGTKSDILLVDTYENMKGDTGTLASNKKTADLKYTRSIYALWPKDDEFVLIHIALGGKGLYGFGNDITKNPKKIATHKVKCTGLEYGKNGKVNYVFPKFAFDLETTGEEGKAADEADADLQAYLDDYLKKNGTSTNKDGGSEIPNEDSSSRNDSGFDSENWREFMVGDKPMKMLTLQEIEEFKAQLEETNSTSSDYYDCLAHAVFEYQKAGKSWESVIDKKTGKKLGDLSEDELNERVRGSLASPQYAGLPQRLPYEWGASQKAIARAVSVGMSDEPNEDDAPF